MVSVGVSMIEMCAKMYEEGRYDGRNEYTTKKCAEIVEKIELGRAPFV